MLVSWNWLHDFVDLEGLDPYEVAERLTLAGLEVEGVHARGHNLAGVVVGRVDKVEPHPNADRLRLCQVFDGTQTLQIVCGAQNVTAGIYAPLATIGTVMPSGMKIKKSKLRGELSEGMLCSASEIGLHDKVDGLLLLDHTLMVGQDIADALALRDVVIDISLTPNRGDCLSMQGVAREIAVLLGRAQRATSPVPTDLLLASTGNAVRDTIAVTIESKDRCSRYCAAVLHNVKIGPSPQWMRRRLEAVGQRPVNNIVDVTNYVNFGYGQPTHAFDLATLHGAEIRIRQAKEGEKLTLLDEVELTLTADDLIIADADRPIALAGVMGGLDTSVNDNTTSIVLEVANFDPSSVRRAARRSHHHSDSSHRFERGVDATQIDAVAERALQLFAAVQPEGVAVTRDDGLVDIVESTWPSRTIGLTLQDLTRIIGVQYTAEETKTALEGLGFIVEGDEAMTVTVPNRRPDIERTIDLVEEVARVIGYDRLPNQLPVGELGYVHQRRHNSPVRQEAQPIVSHQQLDALHTLRTTLFGLGAFEAVNWGIADEEQCRALTGNFPAIVLKNPLGSHLSVMRSTLLAGLLNNVKYNLGRRASRVALFEIGQVFPQNVQQDKGVNRFAGVLSGERGQGWHSTNTQSDAWDITAWLTTIARVLRRPIRFGTAEEIPVWLHPRAGSGVYAGEQLLGFVGQVHPEVAANIGVEQPVYAFELDVDTWLNTQPPAIHDIRVPKTVSADRDLAVVVDRSVSFEDMDRAIRSFEHPLLSSVQLFDVYRGDNIAKDKQSLAFRAYYQDPTDALTDAQIDEAHQALTRFLNEAIGAERRG